jgi:hypothetical protein
MIPVPVGLFSCNSVRDLELGLDLPVPDPQRSTSGTPPHAGSGEATGKPEWNRDIKAYYDSVANEPVPDAIVALMAKLAQTIRK